MSLSTPISHFSKAWNVTWDSKKGNWTSDATKIRCTYPKGGFGAGSGTHFRAEPAGFPASDVTVSYDVFFSKTFDFVKGGKLPGVWGGLPGSGGGQWNDDGWSARVMFRDDGKVVAYVYMCTDQGTYDGEKCALVRNQGPGFDAIAHHTNGAGIDLWRQTNLKMNAGAWNSVSLRVKINDPGKSNGLIALTVNGITKSFDKICWSKRPKKASGIVFSSWFGGGSKDYAPSKTQTADFRNIRYSTS
jgi:hypothetical protein